MCMSSTKRRIGRFHVVVVQLVRYKAFLVSSHNAPPRYDTKNGWLWCSGRQRNVLKSVMHVQSCCFAHKTIFLEVVVFVVLSSLFAAFRRRNPGDVKCLGRGGGWGWGMVTFAFTSAIRNKASTGYILSSWYPLSTKLSFSFYNNKNCVMSLSTSSIATTLEWCSLWVFSVISQFKVLKPWSPVINNLTPLKIGLGLLSQFLFRIIPSTSPDKEILRAFSFSS